MLVSLILSSKQINYHQRFFLLSICLSIINMFLKFHIILLQPNFNRCIQDIIIDSTTQQRPGNTNKYVTPPQGMFISYQVPTCQIINMIFTIYIYIYLHKRIISAIYSGPLEISIQPRYQSTLYKVGFY